MNIKQIFKSSSLLSTALSATFVIANANAVELSSSTNIGVMDNNGETFLEMQSDEQFSTVDAVRSELTSTQGSSFDFSQAGSAIAASDQSGNSAVAVEGVFADAYGRFDMSATTSGLFTYTNTSANTINFTYNFDIMGGEVAFADYAGISDSDYLSLNALTSASVSIVYSNGQLSDNFQITANLKGGSQGSVFDLYSEDNSVTANYFTDGSSIFGYRLSDYAGLMSGSLGAGDSLKIYTRLEASVFGPDFETGARAIIGDPNNLSLKGGLTGEFEVSAVPVPAAVWLFASGLIGLVGFSRRKKV